MVAVDDGKTRGERWNGRDKHAPREKGGGEGRRRRGRRRRGRRRGNLQKQRLPRGLQLRMHLSERGPWRLRGWLRFLPVCRNHHLFVCVRVHYPSACLVYFFSLLFFFSPPHTPPIHRSFRPSITRGRQHPSRISVCGWRVAPFLRNSEGLRVVRRFWTDFKGIVF